MTKTYLISLFLFILFGCKDTVSKPSEKLKPTPDIESLIIDVTFLGIKKDVLIDNSALIQTAIGSNKTLYFPKGKYMVSNFITINGITNLKITGEAGTEIVTSQNKIFTISGNISNLEITNFKFSSTKNDVTNDTEGLIFIAAYGNNDLMDGINVNNCSFTNPKTHANGIKLVSEGTNSLVKNVHINNNRFDGIGRFGVEFQNHVSTTNRIRYTDYEISNNYFSNVGTIQSAPAPSCISVSGYGTNGKINNNEIVEMAMNTAEHIYYGIENAGNVGLETIGNIISAKTYGFTAILSSRPNVLDSAKTERPKIKDWIIKDNIIELTGKSNLDKIRGLELTDVENFIITGNTITTKGYAMRLIGCKSGKITSNVCKVTAGNVLYFQSGSTKNEIFQNTLDGSNGPDHGVIIFNGATTSGNDASANVLIATGGLPGKYVNWNGASNNF